jgi:hypothetical protein
MGPFRPPDLVMAVHPHSPCSLPRGAPSGARSLLCGPNAPVGPRPPRPPRVDRRAPGSARTAFLLATALPLASPPAAAQLVTGQVMEEGTGAPVASAMVHLLDTEGMRAASMPTDGAGRFTLQAPASGTFRIDAVRSGYVSAETPSFEVNEGAVVTVPALHLVADDQALENLPVPGRMIMGRVVAEGFDDPLPSVLVRALDDRHEGVDAAMTDASGRFRLRVPDAGTYRVEASRIGYSNQTVDVVEVTEQRGGRVTLGLEHESIQPDRSYFHNQTNLVRGRAQFNQRREVGMGFHLDRDMLAGMDLQETVDAFRDIPGLQVTIDNSGNYVVRSTMGWRCLHMPQGFNDIRLDEIGAIEIYRSYREVPDDIRYSHLGFQIWGCGVAVIWTKVGW